MEQRRQLLEKRSREELVDLVMEWAQHDESLASLIDVRYGEPKYEDELYKMEAILEKAFCMIENCNHDIWGYVRIPLVDVYRQIGERARQGHIRLAFSLAEMLYRKLLQSFEYQTETG